MTFEEQLWWVLLGAMSVLGFLLDYWWLWLSLIGAGLLLSVMSAVEKRLIEIRQALWRLEDMHRIMRCAEKQWLDPAVDTDWDDDEDWDGLDDED